MNYTYEATGGINVFGCVNFKLIHFKFYRYAINSIVFAKHKALKGIYEKIVIKDVRFPNFYTILYTDSLNGVWLEDELVSYNTATVLIKAYTTYYNSLAETAVRNCRLF